MESEKRNLHLPFSSCVHACVRARMWVCDVRRKVYAGLWILVCFLLPPNVIDTSYDQLFSKIV